MKRIIAPMLASVVVALGGIPPIAASASQGPPEREFTATCTGPGSQSQQGSVAPGQMDNCTIVLSTGSLNSGSTILISVTSPSGVTTSSCGGGSASDGSCTFSRPNGAYEGQTIGSESFQIPMSAVSGTQVRHSARVCDVFGCSFPPVTTGGPGAVVTSSGGSGGGITPPPPPLPPFVTASCFGPNRDGTVYTGQQVSCTVYPFDGNTFRTGQSVDVTVESPIGSTLSSCLGSSAPTWATMANFNAASARCRFTIAAGSVQRPASLGTEVINIPASAQAGTSLALTASYCTEPGPGGEFACTARPEAIPVGGPGAVVSLDPPIAVAAVNLSGIEGQPFSGVVATFSDADPNAMPSEYAATIDWGDGTTVSNGTIEGWSVTGAHSYLEEGNYTASVTIRDLDSAANTAFAPGTTVLATATVADAPLKASGRAINSTNPFAGIVASFADANPYGTVADYRATVHWGDGTTSDGSVSMESLTQSSPVFDVSANHIYAALGPYTIRTDVCDDGGACDEVSTTILVYGLSSAGNFVIGDGATAVGSSTYYWGAQWASMNSLSGGSGQPSFKGFADDPDAAPACATGWSTTPGNSAKPPNSVPSYLAVAVASTVSKYGSRVEGDTAKVVVIKTDVAYGPDPGQAGTGTVVAVLCP
jgi:hypothetical protein